MQTAIDQRILEFQDELSAIEEQGKEIAPYVKALEAFLNPNPPKIPETDFSFLNRTNLTNMGIKLGTLQIKEQELESLVSISQQTHHPHIERLCARIQLIYHGVDTQSGARMITESILWTVAELAAADSKLPLCLFPDMPIGSGEGVLIKNAVTGGEAWLTGKTDYGICTYDETRVDRNQVLNAPDSSMMTFAHTSLTVVQGKLSAPYESMAEATGQAAALCEVTGSNAARYCLSDGRHWIFCIYQKDAEGFLRSYEGSIRTIVEPRPELGIQDLLEADVYKVVTLVYHWLYDDGDPFKDSLYSLHDIE